MWGKAMERIKPSDARLQYMGRIDRSDPDAPQFFWAGSLVQFGFTGDSLFLEIENHRIYSGLQLGYLLDGAEHQLRLTEENDVLHRYEIPVEGDGAHTMILFKRQDATHRFTLKGILLAAGADLTVLPPLPSLKLECFGDSVTAGSVTEAVAYTAAADPPVYDAVYDNAWHSYAMQAARLLHAQVHVTAQGGIALFDGTGYFDNGRYGMETAYDKLCYHPDTEMTPWDFSSYVPDYVTVAIGQNDRHVAGEDCDFTPQQRETWLEAYCGWLADLMAKYPDAVFILMLTVLMHDAYWEALLDEACERMNSPRVKRFRFTRSGQATPGHPRIPEQCEMACELAEYIDRLRGIAYF